MWCGLCTLGDGVEFVTVMWFDSIEALK